MKNILVIGSANMDLTIHADHMPRLGETVVGYGFCENPGGKGANQAAAVGKLGGSVKFLGAVGCDSYGERLLEGFEKNHISFEGIRIPDVSTGTASITVVNGDNFIILNAGANDRLTPEVIGQKADLIKTSDYVIMQLEIPLESVVCATKIAHSAGSVVVLNPAPCRPLPDDLYDLVDMMILNECETEQLTGICPEDSESCEASIEVLRKKGVKTVIITLGEKGCVYNDGDRIVYHPALKVTAVDTTSAGDSFIGALCCRLCEGEPLERAIDYATRVSAITVSRRGASESIPSADEIENL